MTRKIINQTSFTAGEITPRLHSRVETDEYNKGLETGTNCLVTPHGTVRRRNGSQFIAETKDSSVNSRLLRFQFSQTLAYILEVGNEYIRFFRDNGQVLESNITITNITQANPGVVTTSGSHGLSNGDHVYITSVVGMTEVNSSTVPYEVANVTATTFELNDVDGNNINTTGFTAYSSAGTINRIYEISSPWGTSDLNDLQYTQSGSTMYIVHPDYAPRKLISTSQTNWALSEIDFLPPPTYESGHTSLGPTLTPGATTGTGITFTASGSVFLQSDVGRQIINNETGGTGRASIVEYVSTTVVTCDIIEAFDDTSAIADGDWAMDLSPVADLEVDTTQAGAVANIRSEYPSGTLGDRVAISAITQANPGVVTTSSAHGLVDGDKVVINDVVGMTQLNGNIYTVNQLTTTTFELRDDNYANVDTTNYTAYSSGGIVRKRFEGLAATTFRSQDVDRYILMNGGVLQIISVNSGSDVDAEVIKSLNSKDTTGNWTLEEPTWSSSRGYPKSVGQFQERLVFGGTTTQPQTVWMSEIGIFEGFGIGPDDEDSIDITLSSDEVNEISWISSTRDLVIGTSGGEITINSGTSASVTPSSVRQQPRTYHGSSVQQVVNVRDEILFIQNSARKLRTFRYDFNIDGYAGEDLHFLSEHITEGGLTEAAYAQEPDTVIYVVTDEGELLAGTYDRAKRVIAWTKFNTDGDYERVQTIGKGEEDQVWVQVERNIDGSVKRYIELFVFGNGTDDIHAFQDSFLTLSSPITVTNITTANPAVVTTSGSHGLSNGESVIIKDLVDPFTGQLDSSKTNMSSLNDCTFTVAGATGTTFQLTGLDTSAYNSYGSGGNVWENVTAISGLDHLEGKALSLRGDGAVLPSETVSDGAITIDVAAGEVVAGLPYTTTIKTLNHEYDIGLGSMQGQRVRWARPLLKVYRSTRPLLNGEFLPNRNAADSMGKKAPLATGFLEYGPLGWSNTSALTITVTEPLPLELSGISGTIDAGVK